MTSTYSVSLICFDGRQSNLVLGLLSPSVSILEAFYLLRNDRYYSGDIIVILLQANILPDLQKEIDRRFPIGAISSSTV